MHLPAACASSGDAADARAQPCTTRTQMNGQIGRPTLSTAPAHCCLASGPTTQHTRAWQELRKVLLGMCKHGTTPPAGRLNALLLPTLRAHPKLVVNIVAICYHWVRTEQAVLDAIEILSGFTLPGSAADLSVCHNVCCWVRSNPAFPALLEASFEQVPHSAPTLTRARGLPAHHMRVTCMHMHAHTCTCLSAAQAVAAVEPASGGDTRASQAAASPTMTLQRFWDALIGTPPQNDKDAQALNQALAHVAANPALHTCLEMLTRGLQPTSEAQSMGSRCAPA